MRRLLMATALLLCTLVQAGAQEVSQSYSLQETRVLGMAAIQSGRPDIARDIALSLLQRDPDDSFALFLLANAHLDRGELAQAQKAARLSFRFADSPEQRFQAARLTAVAAWNQQKFGAAQWWLRRAADAAPTAERREATVAEFRAVRARNPIQFSLDASVMPSDNVNNGASSEYNIIDGVPVVGWLSPDGQALEGVISTLSGAASYRFRQDARSSTTLGGSVEMKHVDLSSDAEEKVQGLDPRAYDTSRAETSIRHVIHPEGVPYEFSAELALGVQTEAQALDFRFGTASLGYLRGLNDKTGLSLIGAVELRDMAGTVARQEQAYSVQAGLSRIVLGEDVVTGTLFASGHETDLDGRSSTTLGGQIGYRRGTPVGPARLSGSLGYSVTTFPDYVVGFILVPGGRKDTSLSASVSASFDDLSVAGFSPQMTLSAESTRSNVSRFETEQLGISFGVRSTF